jgi:predicted RND superfamily exporter protein
MLIKMSRRTYLFISVAVILALALYTYNDLEQGWRGIIPCGFALIAWFLVRDIIKTPRK